jgi:regulator of sigma E protease
MGILLGVVVGLIVLVLLVVVHELGHAIVAKRNGVKVEEFGVGFPPKAWSKKIKSSLLGKNVEYSLNWLPLGGFVRLQGEHDAADKKGDYGAANYWAKTKILLAGVAMNWLVAVILFTALAFVGMPKLLPNQFAMGDTREVVLQPLTIVDVIEGSPAEKVGLKKGDVLVSINDKTPVITAELNNATAQLRGQTVAVTYKRKEIKKTIDLTLNKEAGNTGYMGVKAFGRSELKSGWSAPVVGVGITVQLTWETLKGLGQVIVDTVVGAGQKLFSFDSAIQHEGDKKLSKVSQSVSGPVGILGVIFPSFVEAGLKPLILLSAVISLSLAVMNFLPIPALDGGRWFTMTVYKLRKKELTKEREEKIQAIGFIVLMSLIILITVVDIGKFFK